MSSRQLCLKLHRDLHRLRSGNGKSRIICNGLSSVTAYRQSSSITPSSAELTAKGRSCLVTGATSGIGHAVLTRLLADGASHIRVVSRDRQRASLAIQRAHQQVGQAHGEVTVIELELDQESANFTPLKLFAGEDDWPAVNTFIHCAGITQSSLAMSTSPSARSSIMRINVEVYMQLLAEFVKSYHSFASRSKTPADASSPSFCAIGVSSLLATNGGYGTSTYAASKAAMIAYNRAVTLETGQIVRKYIGKAPAFRINTVVPGYIDTPMIGGFTEQVRTDLQNRIPSGRFGTAEEVADAIMFLLSNEYANNCTLNLDGGLSAT